MCSWWNDEIYIQLILISDKNWFPKARVLIGMDENAEEVRILFNFNSFVDWKIVYLFFILCKDEFFGDKVVSFVLHVGIAVD